MTEATIFSASRLPAPLAREVISNELSTLSPAVSFPISKSLFLDGNSGRLNVFRAHHSWIQRGDSDSVQLLDEFPVSVDLEPICSETQFDLVISQAQQIQEPVVIIWMANWCRKCIYLKPKLEKLAADYYPRLRFYTVNVNTVPFKLVSRAGVAKMPTIQLWKDGKNQAEVIGGNKAYLVINEVRDMIENGICEL